MCLLVESDLTARHEGSMVDAQESKETFHVRRGNFQLHQPKLGPLSTDDRGNY